MDSTVTITVNPKKRVSLSSSPSFLSFLAYGSKRPTDIPLRQLLHTTYHEDTQTLEVIYLVKRKNYVLVKLHGVVNEDHRNFASQWATTLMQCAYEDAGIKRSRHLKVLINPHGGQGKALAIYDKKVAPVFAAANCTVDITHTTRRFHAHEIAKELPLEYDAVVVVSGDGLIHEVFNGFSEHKTPIQALQTPVAPIPTGSGNGLSLNLLGVQDGFDVTYAALNVVKGLPMKLDLFSITQGDRRRMSFMTQCVGLMADLDLGTEHMRWMGDTRFTVGFFQGLISRKSYPVELSFKLVEQDKSKLLESINKASGADKDGESLDNSDQMLPPLKFVSKEQWAEWTVFDKSTLYIYAGQGPYVGRTYLAFPASLPNDGCIDLVACAMTRMDMIKATDSMINGKVFWHPKMHYFKVSAFRVKPLHSAGFLSVDGEAFPFEEFVAEVHPGLATALSMHGRYVCDFSTKRP